MKKLIIIFVIMFAGLFRTESKAWNADVNFNFFYHNLSPYGEWIEVDYDLVVWKPYNVHNRWSPYSEGQWEYTSYGWYWDSYEPFGWATYHYGRWYYDDYYGWVWVPGYEWGPSWVEWRYSDAYIGWSPLPPYADFRISVGIHFSVNYRTSYHHWNFVTYNRFCHRNVNVYFVDVHNKNYIFNNTKYRTNYYADRGRIINGGVDRNYVERRAGARIVEREVTRTSNLRDYTGSRGRVNSNRVVAFQPERKEVEKFRNSDVKIEKRASSGSNLRRDIVTFRNEENRSREVRTGRNEDIQTRSYSNKPGREENNSSRIYQKNDDNRNPARYKTINPTRNVETRKTYKRDEPVKRNDSKINNPVSRKDVTKSVRESISRSTSSRKSSPEVKRSKRSNPPVSINRNKNSSREKSVRSNSNSRKERSKSTNKSTSRRKRK